MKKIFINLGLSMLVLSSCGTEKRVEVSDKYNYHEIVECDIPVAKRFDRPWGGKKGHPYDRVYFDVINEEEAEMNVFFILKANKKLKKSFSDYAHKKAYEEASDKLAAMYVENFKKYLTDDSDFDFTAAGPQI